MPQTVPPVAPALVQTADFTTPYSLLIIRFRLARSHKQTQAHNKCSCVLILHLHRKCH